MTRASSNERPGERPVAEMACAISPLEYGSPWPLWTMMVSGGGISVELDERVVDAERPVADEDDARALGRARTATVSIAAAFSSVR